MEHNDTPPELNPLQSCDEIRVQAILASRRNANASGQSGEDIENIRAAIQFSRIKSVPALRVVGG